MKRFKRLEPAAVDYAVNVTPLGVIFSIDSVRLLESVDDDTGHRGSPQVDSTEETT